ncbi:MAG: hypothetical protein Q4A16_06475 [Lautropia sp.]|nr:hypothetical protein [Lautropia sp.]
MVGIAAAAAGRTRSLAATDTLRAVTGAVTRWLARDAAEAPLATDRPERALAAVTPALRCRAATSVFCLLAAKVLAERGWPMTLSAAALRAIRVPAAAGFDLPDERVPAAAVRRFWVARRLPAVLSLRTVLEVFLPALAVDREPTWSLRVEFLVAEDFLDFTLTNLLEPVVFEELLTLATDAFALDSACAAWTGAKPAWTTPVVSIAPSNTRDIQFTAPIPTETSPFTRRILTANIELIQHLTRSAYSAISSLCPPRSELFDRSFRAGNRQSQCASASTLTLPIGSHLQPFDKELKMFHLHNKTTRESLRTQV